MAAVPITSSNSTSKRAQTAVDAVAAAVRSGAVTAGETARLLTWTRRERALDELDPFNQMLAVLETAAHLDLLVTQSRLRATVDGDVTKYSLA